MRSVFYYRRVSGSVYPLLLLGNGSVKKFPPQQRIIGVVVFYKIRVLSRIRRWLVLPRTSCCIWCFLVYGHRNFFMLQHLCLYIVVVRKMFLAQWKFSEFKKNIFYSEICILFFPGFGILLHVVCLERGGKGAFGSKTDKPNEHSKIK
jgi:hypothetical protein